jgi:hypothetical protein
MDDIQWRMGNFQNLNFTENGECPKVSPAIFHMFILPWEHISRLEHLEYNIRYRSMLKIFLYYLNIQWNRILICADSTDTNIVSG